MSHATLRSLSPEIRERVFERRDPRSRRRRPDPRPSGQKKSAASQLALLAAERIVSGALNGRTVASLAAELNVSERHLRRALRHELGVSPVELAQRHRLARAHRLLVDTTLSITRVAFASGFQSLRRFNVVFRKHCGMSPSEFRRRFCSVVCPE